MEVQLAPGRAPILAEPDDLRRFSVVATAAPGDLPDLAAVSAGALTFDGTDHAWVSVAWLLEASGRSASAEWLKGFDAMKAYATKQGWTREDPPAIRGHVVWQGAPPS